MVFNLELSRARWQLRQMQTAQLFHTEELPLQPQPTSVGDQLREKLPRPSSADPLQKLRPLT